MKACKTIASLVVLGIGIYMIVKYWGPITPPFLSGIAFTLLGLNQACGVVKG